MRVQLLHTDLRRLHLQADLWSTRATVHRLHIYIGVAERSLQPAEACRQHGGVQEQTEFLELAQESLRTMRGLLAQTWPTAQGKRG